MNKFKEDEELYIIITYSIYSIPCAPAFHNDGILSYICIIILCFASSFLFQKAPLFSCHGSFSKGSGNNFPRFTAHPIPFLFESARSMSLVHFLKVGCHLSFLSLHFCLNYFKFILNFFIPFLLKYILSLPFYNSFDTQPMALFK